MKYDNAEILNMITFALDARQRGNPVYAEFIMTLSLVSNKDPRAIEQWMIECHKDKTVKPLR